MPAVRPTNLPERAYALFEAKGPENAARVRRIVGLIAAVHATSKDWSGLRVLDLGCGEGLFALEAALHGAHVTAIDGRDERMAAGRALAAELQLNNVEFIRADVRSYAFENHGPFDVVLFLGLMYHLDAPALFEITRRTANSTTRALIVDTHFARFAAEVVEHDGEVYHGWTYREHRPDDASDVRRARLLASLSNDSSLWLTPQSLLALLRHVGFPTILQCHVPLQPFQGEDRFTLVALKGDVPEVLTFPWINHASEEDVTRRSRPTTPVLFMPPTGNAREDALLGAAITLGGWVRAHPEFVLGAAASSTWLDAAPRAPDVAIWRRRDLDSYVGRLRRVPPVLAVEIAADDEGGLREKANGYLDAGVPTVWLVLLEARSVLVVSRSEATRFGADDTLPEPPGLVGLVARVGGLLPRALPRLR